MHSFTQCGGTAGWGEHSDVSDIQGRKERIGKGGEIVISAGQKDMVCFSSVQEECFLPGALASPYG